MFLLSRCAYLVVVWLAARSDAEEASLLVTRRVEGAVYPADDSGSECSRTAHEQDPCSCFGGAARRAGVIQAAADDTVIIDAGASFYGSGLFYDEFKGAKSAAASRAAGYDARCLHWRDFLVDGESVASYLRDVGPAVATNIDVSDDSFLNESLVTTFAHVDGVVVLALVDSDELDSVSPEYAGRTLSYEDALTVARVATRSLDPTLTVLVVSGVPASDITELLPAEATDTTEAAALRSLVRKFVEIDLVVVDGDGTLGAALGGPGTIETVENLEGNDASIVVLDDSRRGAALTSLTKSTASIVVLDCESQEDDDIPLDEWKAEVDESMAEELVGYVDVNLDGCNVNECIAGDAAADAVRWWGQADVGLVPVSAVQGSVERYDVHASELFEAFPDLGSDVVLLKDVAGSTLRQILLDVVETHRVSYPLQIDWYSIDGEIEATILFDGIPLDSSDSYSIAALESDAISWGFSSAIPLGVQVYGAVKSYFAITHGTPSTALDPTTDSTYSTQRIVRLTDVPRIHVALLCGDAVDRLQQCDHALHAVELINDKTDGFYDEFLHSARLTAHVSNVGCSVGRSRDALVDLALSANVSFDAVVITCSGNVQDVTSVEAREEIVELSGGLLHDYIVVSPSATAPSLDDTETYPNLVRLATSEEVNGRAGTALTDLYEWHRVAVIHDDSAFGSEAAQAFVTNFLSDNDANIVFGDGVCFGNVTCEGVVNGRTAAVGYRFARDNLDSEIAADIMQSISAAGAKIVYVATYQDNQRILYANVRETGVMFGEGYAYINNLPSESAVIDERNETIESDNVVDIDAAEGLAGALGFIERTPSRDDGGLVTRYLDVYWAAAEPASSACVYPSVVDKSTFCDADDDPATFQDYAAFWVDSIVVYARGVDRANGNTSGTAVADAIAHSEPFEGVSGTIVMDPLTRSRQGSFTAKNFRIVQDRRSLQQVDLPSASAFYADVGEYQDQTLNITGDVEFPGGVSYPPADRERSSGSSGKNDGLSYLWLAVIVSVCLVVILFVIICYMLQRPSPSAPKHNYHKVILNYSVRDGIEEDPEMEAHHSTLEPNSRYSRPISGDYAAMPFVDPFDGQHRAVFKVDDWEYQDDDGSWKQYSALHQTKLSHEHRRWCESRAQVDTRWDSTTSVQAGVSSTQLPSGLSSRVMLPDLGNSDTPKEDQPEDIYQVDLETMTQSRVDGGTTRQVQRHPKRREVYINCWFTHEGYKEQFARSKALDKYYHDNLKQKPQNKDQTHWGLAFEGKGREFVAKAYYDWLCGDMDAPSVVYLTSAFEPTTRSDPNAKDGYIIDLANSCQTRRYARDGVADPCKRVLLFELEPRQKKRQAPLPPVLEEQKETLDPRGPPEEECLAQLFKGETVNVISKKDFDGDEWGYGYVVDAHEIEGWFPMKCVRRCAHNTGTRQVNWGQPTRLYYPRFWRPNVTSVALSADSAEWRGVAVHFEDEWRVAAITRLQNHELWGLYDRLLEIHGQGNETVEPVESLKFPGSPQIYAAVERCPVYHGTSGNVAESIMKSGFDTRLAKSDGRLGQGVYFATQPSKAASYGTDDDRIHIFLCRILVGKAGIGNKGMERASPGCQSTTDDVDKPTEFCIFNNAGANPRYCEELKASA